MDPARTERKHIPDWLNSSLWSSPRLTDASSPSTASTKRPPLAEKSSVNSPKFAHAVNSPKHEFSSTSPKAEPFCEAGVTERLPDTVASTSDPLSARISDGDSGAFGNENKASKDVVQDSIGSHDLHKEVNAADLSESGKEETKHVKKDHDTIPRLEDDESSDLFNSEGPLPSPLSSASYPYTPSFIPSVTRSSSFDSRVSEFNAELSKKVISLVDLHRLASHGIPDSGSIRALTWKLLLGYLPKNRDIWSLELEKKRAEYASFKVELLVTPSEITRGNDEDALDITNNNVQGPIQRHDITQDDHPLSLGKTSVWHQFFVDSEVWEQIDRDVKRTHPDMHFFNGDSNASLDNQEAMKRVLFIFSKLNSGIRYVQGMNEVLAPLYYVFKTDTDEKNSVHAEADSFYCFVLLLGDFRDHFVQQLDNSAVGIRSTISKLNDLLRKHDEELWRHLEHNSKVNPQFYAFRWITLLLTQEFNFPDSLRLWDSLLANPDGPLELLLRVCCSMLISVRDHLLAGDFTSNLKLLQHYPSIDVHHLLRVADNLKAKAPFF